MSYILDALRRAEADRERERGQVPGLHTQPLSSGEAPSAAEPRRWLPWAGGGLLLLAGIGAGSWFAGGAQEAAPAAPAPVLPAAAAPAVSPLPSVNPPAQPPLAAAPVVASPQPSPYLPPAPPRAGPSTAPAPMPVTAAAPVLMAAPTAAPAPVTASALPSAPAPAPAPAAEARIPWLSELPEATRRDLPRIVISGSVYSDDPAGRFVMVNGEVLREGARLGADFVLEQIGPRELVLRFKGLRYRQPV